MATWRPEGPNKGRWLRSYGIGREEEKRQQQTELAVVNQVD